MTAEWNAKLKYRDSPEFRRRLHQTHPSAPFLPYLFRQDGKDRAVGDIRQLQIRYNLSVSAAPSQQAYPFCPFGTFPPDRGNRPLEWESGEGEKTRLLGSSRGGHYIILLCISL